MVFANPSVGSLSQLGWDFANPITAAYEYNNCDVQARQEYVETEGVRGILDHIAESVAEGIIRVDGPMNLVPTKTILSTIALKAILGGTPTGTGTMTYPLGNGNVDTYLTVDRIAKVDTYGLVWVDRATFSSEQGQQLKLALEFLGQTETEGAAGSFPAGLTPPREAPFMHVGATFTLNSVARQVRQISVTINNNYTKDRFWNAQTLATPAKFDRVIDVVLTVPYNSDNTDLYSLAVGSAASGTAVWTDGTNTLTMTFGTIQLAGPCSKPLPGKQELVMQVPLRARVIGSTPTAALVVTL